MNAPKKSEHWHVQYGIKEKTNIIVKVLSDGLHGCINWRKDDFLCDRLGENVQVRGEAFVEKFS